MKNFSSLFISLLLISTLFFTSTFALAHSGRTDSSGGHKDNKNKSGLGSYHYHCGGHPAHLHENGECPYSSKSSSSSTKSTKKPSATPTPIPTRFVDGIEIPGYEFPVAKGKKGDCIKDIQKALIEMGYLDDKADGIFGNKTENAIAAYCEDFNAALADSLLPEITEPLEYDGYLDEHLYVSIIKDYRSYLDQAA